MTDQGDGALFLIGREGAKAGLFGRKIGSFSPWVSGIGALLYVETDAKTGF